MCKLRKAVEVKAELTIESRLVVLGHYFVHVYYFCVVASLILDENKRIRFNRHIHSNLCVADYHYNKASSLSLSLTRSLRLCFKEIKICE